MKILVLIILFILLYILLNKNSKIEKFINRNKKIKIGFLIPTTSKNRNYKKIEEIYFIKIFIINLIPTISKNFEYEIYLGYDYDDLFYINNNIKIKNYFNNNTPKNISLDSNTMYLVACSSDTSITLPLTSITLLTSSELANFSSSAKR